jgi:bacterioferritin-associated ferredoxin
VYVCNCNGIREREVRAAALQGASRPADVFRRCQSTPQCAKCVCDVRRILDEERQRAQAALRFAAE